MKYKFLRESIINAFLLIKPNSFPLQLSKESNITYSHLCKVLEELKAENLIKFEVQGRKRIIILTNKGKELQNQLALVMGVLNNV